MVLIVEDDILIGLALRMVLRIGGHEVMGPATTADEALRLAMSRRPELAFVDIRIAGPEDGIAVARMLTERFGTSCLFLTAEVDQARNAREAALGLVAKPYDPPELLRAVKVVAALRKGVVPEKMPRHLELFR